jgi:transcriptional regulator with XRE-family HTH domain
MYSTANPVIIDINLNWTKKVQKNTIKQKTQKRINMLFLTIGINEVDFLMTHVSAAIGKRIREIRKDRNYTLEDLGNIVHRSKSTLSKYENGEIVLDIETLFEIARAFRISIFSLITLPFNEERRQEESERTPCSHDIFSCPLLYLYYYDGEYKCIRRSMIEMDYPNRNATLYLNTVSVGDNCRCAQIYSGHIQTNPFYTRLIFENSTFALDTVTMVFQSMLKYQTFLVGQIFTVRASNQPIGVKAIIANHKMTEDNNLRGLLQVTPREVKNIKRTNYFIIERVAEAEL